MERRLCENDCDEDRCQAEQHRNKAGKNPRDRKNEFGNVHFFDERRVDEYTVHGLVGGLVEEAPQGIATNQVKRVVGHIEPEHVAEHKGHDAHHQQRVQQAPKVSQDAAAVFYLQIADNQLPQ